MSKNSLYLMNFNNHAILSHQYYSCIMIFTLFMLPFPLTMAVCGFIPMKVKWSSLLEPSGTTMVNCPLMSVVMLILLLADVTVTPGRGEFFSSTMVPSMRILPAATVPFCAAAPLF